MRKRYTVRNLVVMLGLLGLLVAMPLSGYGADLTIGNTSITATGPMTLTGAMSATSFSGSELRAANGSYYAGFIAPGGLASNKMWTLPAADGSAGQVLKTDGAGVLGWVTAGSGGGGSGTVTSISTGAGLTGGPITTSGTIAVNFAGSGSSNSAARSDHTHSQFDNLTLDVNHSNTGLGNLALSSNTGMYNTAFGDGALATNADGLKNTAVGMNALVNNVSGDENTGIGESALLTNNSGSFNTAVGSGALFSNSSGHDNIAIGDAALLYNSSGYDNTGIGNGSLGLIDVGYQNTAVGKFADVSSALLSGAHNATAIGYNAKVDSSNKVRIGNTAVLVIEGAVPFTSTSDIRAKKDIQDISLGLDFITSLRPVEYRMKEGNDRTDFGFIAQDIESLLGTGYNILGIGGDDARSLSLRYTDFIAPMVKAIQDQQQTIQQMQKELDELKALILSMKK